MAMLFTKWCSKSKTSDGIKSLWRFVEAVGGRTTIMPELAETVSSHYASDAEVADWIEHLGYDSAAASLRELLPEGPTGKSADLGEILAAELIEEQLGYSVPIKKLRDKDHREMAMRGEDVIGVAYDEKSQFCLLKGESKSARSLAEVTIKDARAGLEKYGGRPSPHSMIFIGRRLLKSEEEDEIELGADLMSEATHRSVPKSRIAHYMFTMSGNPATEAIDSDFKTADGSREQYAVNLRIPDHGDFVATVYDEVSKLEIG